MLFTDPALNLQSLFTVGAAGYGAAEYGEAATAFNAVHRGGDTYNAYYGAFRSMGQVVSGFGHQALAGGNHAAARGAFLRAASYLANPLYVAIGARHPRRSQAAHRHPQPTGTTRRTSASMSTVRTAAYLPKITTPTLVNQYVGDPSFAGQRAQVMKLLRCPRTLHTFTPATGCQLHCAPMAPQRRNQVIFDWLRKIL